MYLYHQNRKPTMSQNLLKQFKEAQPFSHLIMDDFFDEESAKKIADEFPDYESDAWTAHYLNAIEDKKTSNHWDKFPASIYMALSYLCSPWWVDKLTEITGLQEIYPDYGLHGGGMHSHRPGGYLNIHKDYSIHPKLKLERKFNIIIYMTPNWQPNWGGGLELWSHNEETGKPKELVTKVENKFNRAVLFDTTMNSWHGLPEPIRCPGNFNRNSLAMYYLTRPSPDADPRKRALFVPKKEQENDPEVQALIDKRSKP